MNIQNSNNAYLTYNTNPFKLASSPTLENIQKRGKTPSKNYKKEKSVISPYNNKFVAFVGLLGAPTKDDHLEKTKGVVPLVSREGLCYVHDDNDNKSNIQLRRCDCTLCICNSKIKTNLKSSKCIQAELDDNSWEEELQTKPKKLKNDLEAWNVLESPIKTKNKTNVAVDTNYEEETDSVCSDKNENFKQTSISLEKNDQGKIKCKYVINGRRCYRASKCGNAWRIEIYSKNGEGSKERDVEEEEENIRYRSNFMKEKLLTEEERNGSSTETSVDDFLPLKKSNMTLSLPIVQLYPNNSKKQSTQTSLPYLPNSSGQQSSISSTKDIKYATGQLTSGVIPNELRSYIYTDPETEKKKSSFPKYSPFDFKINSSKKEPNLAIYAYPYSESCSNMLDNLLDSDKNKGGVHNCEADCKTMNMIKSLQEKIDAHEKSCPANCETLAAIKELQKKVEELQKGKSVEDKSTYIPEKIKSSTTNKDLPSNNHPRKDMYSQTPSLASGVSYNTNLVKDSTDFYLPSFKKQSKSGISNKISQDTCTPSCHETPSPKLQPINKVSTETCTTSCHESSSMKLPPSTESKPQPTSSILETCIASCVETSSTEICPVSCQDSSTDGPEPKTSSQETYPYSWNSTTDESEIQPKSSIGKGCPAVCQDEAFIKIIHDRIKKYVKTCPSSCFNNSLIKVLQSKIEVLEKAIPKYENSKRKLSEDTFGLSDLFESQQNKQVLVSSIPKNTDEELHRRVTMSSSIHRDDFVSDIFGLNQSEKIQTRKPTPYLYYQFAPSITLISTGKGSDSSETPESESTEEELLSGTSKKGCGTHESLMKFLEKKINECAKNCPNNCGNNPDIKVLQKKVASLEKAAMKHPLPPSASSELKIDQKDKTESLSALTEKSEAESTKAKKVLSLDSIPRQEQEQKNCQMKNNDPLCKAKTFEVIPEMEKNKGHPRKCFCCTCASALHDGKNVIAPVLINSSKGKPEAQTIPEKKIEGEIIGNDKLDPPAKNGTTIQTEEVYCPKKNSASSTDEDILQSTKSTAIDNPLSQTVEVQTKSLETLGGENKSALGDQQSLSTKSQEDKPREKGSPTRISHQKGDCLCKPKQPSKIPVLKNDKPKDLASASFKQPKQPPCTVTTCQRNSEPCNVIKCKKRHHTHIPLIFKNNPNRLKPQDYEGSGYKMKSPCDVLRTKLRPNNLTRMFSNKALKSDCCDSNVIRNLQNKIDALEKAYELNKLKAANESFRKTPPDVFEALKSLHEKVEALEKNYQPGKKVVPVESNGVKKPKIKCPSNSKCKSKVGQKNYLQGEVPKGETSGGVYKVEIPSNENQIEKMLKNVERRQDSFPKIPDSPVEVTTSRSEKIKLFFKKKFKHGENGSNKSGVCSETSCSSLVKAQNSKDFSEKHENKQQERLMQELEIQRNELRELKILLQSHLSQEKQGKYKNIIDNTTILHRAMVFEKYSKPNFETPSMLNIETPPPLLNIETPPLLNVDPYKKGVEDSNNDIITIRPYKSHKSSQTNFEKPLKLKLSKNTKSSQTSSEKSNKLKLDRKNKSSQTSFEKTNNKLVLYKKLNKQSLTNLGSFKLFHSYSCKKLHPQEVKSVSCPDCNKRKKCKVKEYSKSEIIKSQDEKKKTPKYRKRKKLWLLMLCKFCFCK